MRPQTIALIRQYITDDNDDPTMDGPETVGGLPVDPLSARRFERLMVRGLREHEQEIRELRQRVTALEAKAP